MSGNNMNSIWKENTERVCFNPLTESKHTDVLIIGGGITGILCAYMLKEQGVDCILVEADKICSGITKDTTAKITIEHGLIYDKLIRRYGQEKAYLYLEAQLKAFDKYADMCKKISCDYETKDFYVYSINDRKKVEREVEALKRLGFNTDYSDELPLPFKVSGAIRIDEQAQFHPLKFAYELAKKLSIYENTKVREIMPGKAITQYGEITFKRMIIATHFPILNKHGSYFLKMYQHRSYVLALDGAPKPCGMYVDESDTGLSFRTHDNLLLLGGGGHRTGKKGGNWRELEEFAKKYCPDAKITARWATQDCMTLDSVPYIGQYSKHTPDLFVATGFNKWGMTSAMVSAMMLSDMVRNEKNKYEAVFSPLRSILHPQLAVNAFESTVGLLKPTAPRCPHLGCALIYNPDEHSWDCPCHGSRFAEDGKLIDNPATDDKKNMPPICKKTV